MVENLTNPKLLLFIKPKSSEKHEPINDALTTIMQSAYDKALSEKDRRGIIDYKTNIGQFKKK